VYLFLRLNRPTLLAALEMYSDLGRATWGKPFSDLSTRIEAKKSGTRGHPRLSPWHDTPGRLEREQRVLKRRQCPSVIKLEQGALEHDCL
jgi:hypothetical protein